MTFDLEEGYRDPTRGMSVRHWGGRTHLAVLASSDWSVFQPVGGETLSGGEEEEPTDVGRLLGDRGDCSWNPLADVMVNTLSCKVHPSTTYTSTIYKGGCSIKGFEH